MNKTPAGPITCVLVEDHTIVRQGLRALLQSHSDLEVVGEASNGRDAVEVAVRLLPDVVIMDLGMPGLNGVEATARIKKAAPKVNVLVLSMHAGEEYVLPAVRAGATGYLLKGSGLEDLVSAIRALDQDKAFFSPEAARVLADEARHSGAGRASGHQALSGREREILQLVAEGKKTQQIAEILHISAKTVEGHRGHIMAKLGIHDIASLVRYAIRCGLVQK